MAAATVNTADLLQTLSARGERYELIHGDLIEMSPAGFEHGGTTMTLSAYATLFVLQNRLGRCTAAETGYYISRQPDTVLASDWAFVRTERLPEARIKGYLPLVPDLVLETKWQGDTQREMTYKAEIWLQAGVRTVWVMNPEQQTVTVYIPNASPSVLTKTDTLTGGDILTGFALPLASIFD